MKILIFVSTGRCGTKRIYEILHQFLPSNIAIVHQMRCSRIANILGNITISTNGLLDFSSLYNLIISKYCKNKFAFISTDPLSSNIIPDYIVSSSNTQIIHLIRDEHSFSRSFFSLSRNRIKSFIAHNFIPFWQPGIYPLENIFNKHITEKYALSCILKNAYFEKKYNVNHMYKKIPYTDIFEEHYLENIINDFLGLNVTIPMSSLIKKSNESKRK